MRAKCQIAVALILALVVLLVVVPGRSGRGIGPVACRGPHLLHEVVDPAPLSRQAVGVFFELLLAARVVRFQGLSEARDFSL